MSEHDQKPRRPIDDDSDEDYVTESDESDNDVAGLLESDFDSDVEETLPVWGNASNLKDLQSAATARGLSKTGSKSQILERLEEAALMIWSNEVIEVCHHKFAGPLAPRRDGFRHQDILGAAHTKLATIMVDQTNLYAIQKVRHLSFVEPCRKPHLLVAQCGDLHTTFPNRTLGLPGTAVSYRCC